ncbi:MAG: C39 family peptidase [Clostridium sp.]
MGKFSKILTISLATFITISTTTFATTLSKNGANTSNSTDKNFWAVMQKKDEKAKLYSDFKDGKIDKNNYLKQSEKLKIDNVERKFITNSKTNAELQKQDKSTVLTKDMQDKLNNTIDTTNSGISTYGEVTPTDPGMIWDLYQQPQQRNYYCAPATVASILGAKNLNYAQTTLASYLGTTESSGTAWYNGGTSYPVRDVLNSLENTSYYAIYAANSNSPSELSYRVKYSIDRDYGVAANISEVYNGAQSLPGHPNMAIEHWVPIDGYYNNGSSIHYAEPVYNATSVRWYASVTAPYFTVPDYVMSYVVWEKGLVW